MRAGWAEIRRRRDAFRGLVGSYVRMLGYAWRAAPMAASLLMLAQLVEAAVPASLAWSYKLVVDGVARVGEAGFDARLIWSAAAFYATTLLLAQAARAALEPLDNQMTEQLQGQMSLRLLELGDRQAGLAFYDDEAVQNDLRRARGSLDYVLLEATSLAPDALKQLAIFVTLSLLLARLHPALPLLLIVTALPRMSYETRLQYNLWSGFAARSPHFRWMNYLSDLLLRAEFAKEVRLFGLGDYFLGRYRRTFEQAHQELVALRRGEQRGTTLFGILNSAVTGGAYVAIVLAASRHRLTLGDVALYTSATYQLSGTLERLIRFCGALVRHHLRVQCFHDLLDRPPVLRSGTDREDVGASPMRGATRRPGPCPVIDFRDVSFSYPRSATPALQEITLRIEPGETIAIVGENGAGKTTLASLIARLYDPSGGDILVDGVPLRSLDVREWRRQLAVVSQEFLHLEATLRENLVLGAPSPRDADAALWAACDRVGVGDAARALPRGLDQPLGRRFEGGVDLSGGEWQKVALARAALRDTASVILLDEPTSALDAPTEQALFHQFAALAEDRTTILISHRFSTVAMADRIVVLDRGAILEDGSHAELMARGGRYAELFELQAARYR